MEETLGSKAYPLGSGEDKDNQPLSGIQKDKEQQEGEKEKSETDGKAKGKESDSKSVQDSGGVEEQQQGREEKSASDVKAKGKKSESKPVPDWEKGEDEKGSVNGKATVNKPESKPVPGSQSVKNKQQEEEEKSAADGKAKGKKPESKPVPGSQSVKNKQQEEEEKSAADGKAKGKKPESKPVPGSQSVKNKQQEEEEKSAADGKAKGKKPESKPVPGSQSVKNKQEEEEEKSAADGKAKGKKPESKPVPGSQSVKNKQQEEGEKSAADGKAKGKKPESKPVPGSQSVKNKQQEEEEKSAADGKAKGKKPETKPVPGSQSVKNKQQEEEEKSAADGKAKGKKPESKPVPGSQSVKNKQQEEEEKSAADGKAKGKKPESKPVPGSQSVKNKQQEEEEKSAADGKAKGKKPESKTGSGKVSSKEDDTPEFEEETDEGEKSDDDDDDDDHDGDGDDSSGEDEIEIDKDSASESVRNNKEEEVLKSGKSKSEKPKKKKRKTKDKKKDKKKRRKDAREERRKEDVKEKMESKIEPEKSRVKLEGPSNNNEEQDADRAEKSCKNKVKNPKAAPEKDDETKSEMNSTSNGTRNASVDEVDKSLNRESLEDAAANERRQEPMPGREMEDGDSNTSIGKEKCSQTKKIDYWDADLEDESAVEENKNLGPEKETSQKGNESAKNDQNQPSADGEQSAFSKFISFFGFSGGATNTQQQTPQGRQFCFNLCVQQPAFLVELRIWDPKSNRDVHSWPMQPTDETRIYWWYPAYDYPKHFMYYHVVKLNSYGPNIFYTNFHEKRKIEKLRSDYSVFRYSGGYRNDFFTGPFFFARFVFSMFSQGKWTLEESLDEYDQIRLGYKTFPIEDRQQVAKWIQQQLTDGKFSEQSSLFFAHVIQHFDKRLLHKTKKNDPLLKSLMEDVVASQLLSTLRQCNKEQLKKLVPDVEHFVAYFLFHSKDQTALETVVHFCFIFGVDFLKILHQDFTWSEEANSANLAEVYAILKNMTAEDRNGVLSFMINRAPSISCAWMVYEGLLSFFQSQTDSNFETLKKTCQRLLTSRHSGKLVAVFDKSSWQAIPVAFKADFVDLFLEVLLDQVKRKGVLNAEEEESAIAFFTDEIVLSNQCARDQIVEASNFPQMQKIIVAVLQNTISSKYWIDTSEEIKEKVYNNVIIHQPKSVTGKKSLLLHTLQSVNEIFRAFEVCPCDNMKEMATEKSHATLKAVDLAGIADEFENINELQPEVQKIYFDCLRSCIDKEVKRDHNHANLIALLNQLSSEEKSGKSKLLRITQEVLFSLCLETKYPANDTGKTGQQDFLKMFQGVFVNRGLWSVLMDVMIQWQEESEYPQQLEVLHQAISSFEEALEAKDIKIKDLKRLSEDDHKILLGKIHEFFSGKKCYLEDLISSCVDEEKNAYQELDQLSTFLNFINKITEKKAVVDDIEDILKETTKKKKNYKEMTLRDVLDEDYWSSAKTLLESRSLLRDMKEYRVFYNAAQAHLEDEMMGDEMLKCSLEEVTMILTEDGRETLRETCETLFTDPGAMSVIYAQRIMKGVTNLKKELEYISTLFKCQEMDSNAEALLQRLLDFPSIHKNVKAFDKVLESLSFRYENDLSEFVEKDLEEYEDLAELYEATREVVDIQEPLHGSYGDVIKELSQSTELIKLLRETAHDDVRNLIDAVEVHSDTTVAAKEVSDFIEIHKFLSPVLIAEPRDFFNVLTERLRALGEDGATGIAARIKDSGNNAHSLRNIYKNVANRGEMTKEIVSKALRGGKYKINSKGDDLQDDLFIYHETRSEEEWEYSLSYQEDDDEENGTSGGKSVKHDMEKLQDLKSRALLIVNTEKKQQSSTDESVDFQSFIKMIDLLNEIVATGEELQRSGHPDYRTYWSQGETLEEIESICEELKTDLRIWEETVRSARESNFFLNFFHTKQLWVLKEFFEGINRYEDEAFSLLRLIDTSTTKDKMRDFQAKCKVITNGKYEEQFNDIASHLEEFFVIDYFHGELKETDEKHGLFVVPLRKGSNGTASVVMQLFENANASPEPKRVLFCHSSSTWYEIDLFLRRCFQENSTSRGPYCLANVESLTTDLQFQLIDSIREHQKPSKTNYWLALICRGGEHHHIVNQFRECTKNIRGMTDGKLRLAFQEWFPDVSMVTSDLPGLGKTELIHERALEKRKTITSFAINGPVSRDKLVHGLIDLSIDEDCLLHIDVSEVDDPLLVDTFLFELIVLGMVSSGTKIFHIPTRFIAIEVANTLQHSLRDSLSVTKCFHRIHKAWSFENFMCSQENGSAVQVVCQYLKAYDNQTLEKESLTLKDLKDATPLKESKCRDLIQKHFRSSGDLSYNVIETFLNVLATQLRKFSASLFFRPENLKDMLGEAKNVRVSLFEALKDVSVEFATRSVGACKEVQALALQENDPHLRLLLQTSQKGKSAAKMVDRVEGMVKWADENHLVVMFQEAFSISALFRDLSKVPDQVKALFKNQNAPLKDLGNLDEQELKDKLKKILFADTRSRSQDFDSHSYVLTPDNILKMALIIQRIRAGVPVIVMGETGCGKTSLVRYLANSCGVQIEVKNIHAGIYEKDIVEFTQKQVKEAQKDLEKQVWVFFDEINTCDYLGLINDIICHRTLNGKELPPNLVFIAACNPYCLRPTHSIVTAGLTGKSLTDEYSNLVYRVKPLPETMMDYVWDYGSLDPKDERAYIERMVDELEVDDPDLVVDLLATSQAFIREVEGSPYCVSLRDVRRCILLAEWFMKMIKNRPQLDDSKLTRMAKNTYDEAQEFEIEDRSIILALAHSYQCRIPSSEKRHDYRLKLERVYTKHLKGFSASELDLIIRAEQEEYLARMELPDGTARNTALRENVFVILVCILNKIPVFVVGKPGCSKSLSMQVIRSNLRGKDSKDEFFSTLPQLLVVSYQGSESSTSEGILKVFEKAEKYEEHNKQDESIPVVLLDEVGLAEISKYNPLKVLHRLLEPENQEFPNVAVVGISNWALDAAKMNRAIHLSRPEPTCEDLKETGMSILEAQLHNLGTQVQEKARQDLGEVKLDCLAQSYFEYHKHQIHENFHGLRDYYSLIKCLSRSFIAASDQEESENACNTFRALQRNFGGLTMKEKTIDDIYAEKSESLYSSGILETREEFPVTNLISDNLNDLSARHLMLITSGDSALTIMDKTLSDLSREKVIIYGSKFEEDISEDYSYRILSRIILHMERDCVLVLRDLESVYGSLYDMLNQNYVVVGKKKNCRVALGPYSNPMCQVHDGFRCIVLVDEDKVDYTDPPFLNRFEKQLLRYSDVLREEELRVIDKLWRWIKGFCKIEKEDFKEEDVFLGLHTDTLASLVLLLRQRDVQMSELFQVCKKELMAIATPEGVLRSLRSDLYKEDPTDVKDFYEGYFFKTPVHGGLKGFIDSFKSNSEAGTLEHPSLKYFVMTHSSIHTDVEACLKGSFTCQVEKLGAFKSEKQLSKHIQMFWSSSDKDLLVFQCKPNLDGEHISLMKSMIEQEHERYLKLCLQKGVTPKKSICIIIHLQKGDPSGKTKQWQFNFLRDWKQATLDSLEEPEIPISVLLGESVFNLMKTEKLSLKKIIADKLMWCFTRLKYPPNLSDQESLNHQVTKLQSSKTMMRYLEKLVLRWIQQHHDKVEEGVFWSSSLRACDWQINVSCDKKALLGSLAGAMQRYIDQLVRRPLAKAIYLIASRLTFESFQRALNCAKGMGENERFLAELIQDEDLFNIDEVPDPQNAKCYVLTQTNCSLNFPFSIIFFERIGRLREKYLEEWRQRFEQEEINLESEATEGAKEEFFQELCTDIKNTVPQLFSRNWLNESLNEYMEDIFDYMSVQHSSNLSRAQRIKVLKAACVEYLNDRPETDVALLLTKIHFSLWRHGSSFLSILQFLSVCPSIFIKETENLSKECVKLFESRVGNAKKFEVCSRNDEEEEANESFGADDKTDEGLRATEDGGEAVSSAQERNDGVENRENDDEESNEEDDSDDNQVGEDEEDNEDDGDDSDDAEESDDESSEDDSEGDEEDDDESGSDDSDNDSEDGGNEEDNNLEEEPYLEDNEEETDEENVAEPFMKIIFEKLCKRLIPTDDLIRELGSLQTWKTAANSFVSLVTKSGLEPSRLFQNLRVCSDFANMVLSSTDDKPFPLFFLGELSLREGEEGDLHNCFDRVLDIMDDVESTASKADEFKISFLWRCLGSCESEEQFQSIFFKACTFPNQETLALASPLIYKMIFLGIVSEGDLPIMEILEDSAGSSDYSFLPVLEEALTRAAEDAKGVQDCHLATICLQALDRMTQEDLDFDDTEVSSSTSPTMKCLKTAMGVVKEPKKNQDIVKLLTAVSYVRNFLKSVAQLVLQDPLILKQETGYSGLLKYISSSCLEAPRGSATDNPRKAACMLYFLRLLRQELSLYELRRLCEESPMLPALTTLSWSEEISKVPIKIFKDVKMKDEFDNALLKLIERGDSNAMKTSCSKLATDAKRRKAFACSLMEGLYLSHSNQVDTVNKAVDSILKFLPKKLPQIYKQLVFCLTGKEDFKGKELSVSAEVSLSSLRRATIVLHLLAILTSACSSPLNIDRPFFSYLLDPSKTVGGCVLAQLDPLNEKPSESVIVLTCSCRTAFSRSDQQPICPQCNKSCSTPEENGTSKSPVITVPDELSVCDMSPSSFRLLRVLVNAALFAGVSLDAFSRDTLATFLSLEQDKVHPVEQCLSAIDDDLDVLKRLWGFNEEQVVSTIHLLMEETASLLLKPTGRAQLTDQSRKEIQNAFSDTVNKFFKSQKDSDKSQQNVSPRTFSLEAQIDEKDLTEDFTEDKRNSWLPRLFRFTKQKSLDDLCASYNKASESDKKKHGLLGLFIQYMKVLPMIGHLYPVVKFSNLLERHFGRRLSRKDSEKMIGEDIIKGDSQHYKELKKSMTEFLSSWEIVRSVIEGETAQEVPHLTKISSVSYFLVDQGFHGQYLYKVILALQRIQNEFQGKVLQLALEGSCPALDFLKRSDSSGCSSSLPIVHVQDVKKSELICFEWDDEILSHSYHDTEYGKGHEILHDFGKIESELAGRYLIGKVYLGSDGGLRQFPYSNELFHTCANVLNDISERLPQKPLNSDQQNRLSVLRDKKIKGVQDLLDHLEVIICWLSKTSFFIPRMTEMPLVDYVRRKLPTSNLLPKKLFEDPHNEFQLCHVVGMYQKLEEFLAEASAETVPNKYRRPLSEEGLQKVTKVFGSMDQKMVVVTTLRRFIFRYLLSDQGHQDTWDPQENAVKYLFDPSLWPLDLKSDECKEDELMVEEFEEEESKSALQNLIERFIPRSMLVCEVYSVMSFYDKAIKESQQQQMRSETSPRKPTRSKTKLAVKFKVSGFA